MSSDNFNLVEQVYTSVALAFQMYNHNKKARSTAQNCYIIMYNTSTAQRTECSVNYSHSHPLELDIVYFRSSSKKWEFSVTDVATYIAHPYIYICIYIFTIYTCSLINIHIQILHI